jgi:hypothetical protein
MKRKSSEILQCGSCTYLNREKVFEQKCMELGKIPTSKSCTSHTPDVFTLVSDEHSVNVLKNLAAVTKNLSVNELQILAALFLRERLTRKAGYHFYMKVYYRFSGQGGYLSNYVTARILDANKERVRLIGMDLSKPVSVTVYAGSDSIIPAEKFKDIKNNLIKANKLIDPGSSIKCSSSSRGIISTLDLAVDEGAIMQEEIVSSKDDLVTLVSKMGRGLILKKGKKKKSGALNDDGSVDIKWF